MAKTNEKVYLLAAIESMMNQKDSTNLGNYILEYQLELAPRTSFWNNSSMKDAAIAILVRLKNKTTGKVEWGNIYYKVLIKNGFRQKVTMKKLYQKIMNGSWKSKLDFIMKPEQPILKRPYATSFQQDSYEFFADLGNEDASSAVAALGGMLPRGTKEMIEETLLGVMRDSKVSAILS